MDWGWRFLTESEALAIFIILIFSALVMLLIEVIKIRVDIKDLLTEIRDALEKK